MLKYISVTVPCYIPIAIMGLITGAILTANTSIGTEIIYAAISLSFVVAGFNTLNGVYDKDIDRLNKPHRPIAKGTLSTNGAKNYALLLYILAFVISFKLNIYFIIIILSSIVLTSFYSIPRIRLRKRYVLNTFTGLVFYGIVCPLAGWALYPTFPIPLYQILFLLLLGSGISVTKDFEDIYGDSAFSIKTFPTVLGIGKASILISMVIIFSFLYLAILCLFTIIEIKYLSILILLPWAIYNIYRIKDGKNLKNFFLKNIFLVIVVEFMMIAITLI